MIALMDVVRMLASPMSKTRTPIVLMAALFAVFLGFSTHARSEIYTVITNPGEDCSTQMNIGWQADLDDTNAVVVYTTKSDKSWAHATTVTGKFKRCEIFDGIYSRTPKGSNWNEEAKFLDYGVTLTGLRPDTDYMY